VRISLPLLSCGKHVPELSQFFFERKKESIEDLSVELSHGSGTCLPQESKGSDIRTQPMNFQESDVYKDCMIVK
jgi:hypothetical protein